MNPVLGPLLEDYIRDTYKFHTEYHTGRIEQCPKEGCRLAVDLKRGAVTENTYRDITDMIGES